MVSDDTSRKWTNELLDDMRKVGDKLADDAVNAVFESGDISTVQRLMNTLVENDYPAPEELPRELESYLKTTSLVPAVSPQLIAQGQVLFERWGPEILMVLACYSLPASYAARKGVQVLYRTGYLNHRPNHRLFETTQMVIDVLSPGGLGPGGRGVRTIQKVRLMHAAIRRLILNNRQKPWDTNNLGVPINQEDLAGTLIVFSYLIIDGLSRLGIHTTPEEQQSYLETWRVIAKMLGIEDGLIPVTMAEAKELCELIQERQVQPSNEGKAMNDALIQMMEHQLPPGSWRRWPAAFMRHFLPPKIADDFEIPHHAPEEEILQLLAESERELEVLTGYADRRWWILKKFALFWLQSLVSMHLGAKRTPFAIPTKLHSGWAHSHRISVWELFRRKLWLDELVQRFNFVTVWKIEAPLQPVWEAMRCFEGWPGWWKGVEQVQILDCGDPNRLGFRSRQVWKSKLPYKLRFEGEIVRIEPMSLIEVRSEGDLDGTGLMRFAGDGTFTTFQYDWSVYTTKPSMNVIAILPGAKSLFSWNHRVIMDWGAEGLARKLGAKPFSTSEQGVF